jgi:dUTP pyrophosphatase
VVLQNLDAQPFVIRPGYRIAQLILENFTTAEVVEVPTEFTPLCPGGVQCVGHSDRGAGGFGSTGI